MLCVIAVLVCVLVNNNRKFKKKQEQESIDTIFRQLVRCHDKQEAWHLLCQHVSQTQVDMVEFTRQTFRNITNGLMYEDIKALRKATAEVEEHKAYWKRYRRKEIIGMRHIDYLQAVEKNTWFHLGCNNLSQIIYCLKRMLEPCVEHVDNNFNPLPQDYIDELLSITGEVDQMMESTAQMIRTGDFKDSDALLVEGNALKAHISQLRHKQQDRIQQEDSNIKIDLLYLSTLQETQELVSMMRHLLRASKRFQE